MFWLAIDASVKEIRFPVQNVRTRERRVRHLEPLAEVQKNSKKCGLITWKSKNLNKWIIQKGNDDCSLFEQTQTKLTINVVIYFLTSMLKNHHYFKHSLKNWVGYL